MTSQLPSGRRGPGRVLCPSPAPTGFPGAGKRTRRLSGGQRKRAPRRLGGQAGLRGGWSVSKRGLSQPRGTPSPHPASPPLLLLSRPWPIFPEPFLSHHFRLASMASLTSRTFHLRAPAFMGAHCMPGSLPFGAPPPTPQRRQPRGRFLVLAGSISLSSLQCVSFRAPGSGPHAGRPSAGRARPKPARAGPRACCTLRAP